MQQHSIIHGVDTAATCKDDIADTRHRMISNSVVGKPVLILPGSLNAIVRYSLSCSL